MRTQLLLPAALVLGTTASAQINFPFPDSAARWVNTLYDVQPFPPPAQFYLQDVRNYCMDGTDTLINGLSYARLDHCNAGYKGALRDDAGRIYYVPADSTQEFLLYDFTLTAGDTTTVYFEPAFFGPGQLAHVEINNVLVDQDLGGRKVWYLQAGAEWIEGIGAAWGLLSEPWVNISNYQLRLECMSHLDTIRYPLVDIGPGVCALNTGVPVRPATHDLTVFPNPTDGLVQLRWDGPPAEGEVQLTAADGRLIPLAPVWQSGGATLDLRALAPGLYFLRMDAGTKPVVRTILRL